MSKKLYRRLGAGADLTTSILGHNRWGVGVGGLTSGESLWFEALTGSYVLWLASHGLWSTHLHIPFTAALSLFNEVAESGSWDDPHLPWSNPQNHNISFRHSATYTPNGENLFPISDWAPTPLSPAQSSAKVSLGGWRTRQPNCHPGGLREFLPSTRHYYLKSTFRLKIMIQCK